MQKPKLHFCTRSFSPLNHPMIGDRAQPCPNRAPATVDTLKRRGCDRAHTHPLIGGVGTPPSRCHGEVGKSLTVPKAIGHT